MEASFSHSPITLGTNTASGLSLSGQTLSLNDVFVQIAGDTMTGTLVIDIPADNSALKIVQNATQTTFPIQVRNSADSAYTSAIDGNGRLRSVASTSSGLAWMDNTLASTTYLTINHTSVLATITNGTGSLSIEGASGSEVVINNVAANVNTRIESVSNPNIFMIDADLNSNQGGIGIGTNAQSGSHIYVDMNWGSSSNSTALNVNATQNTSAVATLKAAVYKVTMSHTSGSVTGANGAEYNFAISGNGGTTGTLEVFNMNGSVSTGAILTTGRYIHTYDFTNSGTVSNWESIRIDEVTSVTGAFAIHTMGNKSHFNDNGAAVDFIVESDTDANALYVHGTNNTVQVGAATASDSAKFYVSGKISTSGEMEINGDLNHDGSNIGVFGTAPTTKQTVSGSRGGNAALASLLTALAAYGLVTDSSSA